MKQEAALEGDGATTVVITVVTPVVTISFVSSVSVWDTWPDSVPQTKLVDSGSEISTITQEFFNKHFKPKS